MILLSRIRHGAASPAAARHLVKIHINYLTVPVFLISKFYLEIFNAVIARRRTV